MSEIAKLIERLEKAPGRDREINTAIFLALHPGWTRKPWKRGARREHWFNEKDEIQWGAGTADYTGSIDAAMMLAVDGFAPHQLTLPQGPGCTFGFEIFPPSDHPAWECGSIVGRGQTAPTAIAAAWLKAAEAGKR